MFLFKYFEKQRELIRKIDVLQRTVVERNNTISKLISEIGPGQVVEKVMGRNISFYKYQKLDFNAQKAYYYDARMIINNATFKNELNYLINQWVEFIAYKSKDHQTTENLRMCVNALELFKERLTSIEDPEKKVSEEDLYSIV